MPNTFPGKSGFEPGVEPGTRRAILDLSRRIDASASETALNDLADVNAPAPSNDQVLTWNAATSKWINQSPGAVVIPDPLLLSDGTAGAPTYSFASDTDTGVYLPAANQLGFTAGGTQVLQLATTDVDVTTGHLNVISNTGSPTIKLGEWATGSNYAAIETDTGYLILGSGTGVDESAYLRTKGTGSLQLGTNGSTDLTIANGGSVGIGTTSPAATLHVQKDVDAFVMKVENDGDSTASDGLWVDTRWNTSTNTPFKVTSNSGAASLMTIKGDGEITGTKVQTTGSAPGSSVLLKSHTDGYTYTGWLNTVSGSNTATPSRIYTNSGGSDSFVRYMTLANFRTSVADQTVFCNPSDRELNSTATRTANTTYSHTFNSTVGGVAMAGAKAVIVSLAVRSTAAAYFIAWQYGQSVPPTSQINLVANVIGNVQITLPIDSSRRCYFRFGSGAGNLVIMDVFAVIF
jgi:hypothetical protein